MYLAKVIGKVWATRKEETLRGAKFLLVQHVDLDGVIYGSAEVVIDRLDAGEGEVVIVVEGSSARSFLPDPSSPVDSAVVGILDLAEMKRHGMFSKIEVTGG